MNSPFLCLSLSVALNQNPVFIPHEVQVLTKNRLTSEYKKAFPTRDLFFDSVECENKGRYFYTPSEIIIEAENSFWQGRRSFPIELLVDGRTIHFPSIQDNDAKDKASLDLTQFWEKTGSTQGQENHSQKTAFIWVLGALALGGAFLYFDQNPKTETAAPAHQANPLSPNSAPSPNPDPWGRVKNF